MAQHEPRDGGPPRKGPRRGRPDGGQRGQRDQRGSEDRPRRPQDESRRGSQDESRRGPQGEVSGEALGRRPVRAPRSSRATQRRPSLPQERPRLQREAYRELRASVPPARFEDVARAYGAAGEALGEGKPERALPYLEWAKEAAPRSSSVREALGIARYLTGDYAGATSELSTYRRLSGREDQNHLLADSARALGRPERVAEYVQTMERAGVDRERLVEGYLVLAGELSDRADLEGALAVLERADLRPRRVEPWHPRVWYAAAVLAERLGQVDVAREYLDAVLAVDDEFLDAGERLERLGREVTPPGSS